MARKYSVAEIDQMRSAIECEHDYGCKPSQLRGSGTRVSRAYMRNERTVYVEERLRTYMLAGVEPEELEG